MARPAYITEEFYKEVQFELEKYTNDYNAIMVNNPAYLSLLSGDRKPQIRF